MTRELKGNQLCKLALKHLQSKYYTEITACPQSLQKTTANNLHMSWWLQLLYLYSLTFKKHFKKISLGNWSLLNLRHMMLKVKILFKPDFKVFTYTHKKEENHMLLCGECSSGWLIRPLPALPAFIVESGGLILNFRLGVEPTL